VPSVEATAAGAAAVGAHGSAVTQQQQQFARGTRWHLLPAKTSPDAAIIEAEANNATIEYFVNMIGLLDKWTQKLNGLALPH
jgi:hypothetical protein